MWCTVVLLFARSNSDSPIRIAPHYPLCVCVVSTNFQQEYTAARPRAPSSTAGPEPEEDVEVILHAPAAAAAQPAAASNGGGGIVGNRGGRRGGRGGRGGAARA